MKNLFSFITISLLLVSCGENKKDQQKDKPLQNTEASQEAVSINYELYQPENQNLKTSLFIVIDAHGNGELALNKFRWAAESYGFNLITLNNVSNNDAQFQKKINAAIVYANKLTNSNFENIYLAGFSGGARMAISYASKHNSQGVIMLGAGPEKQNLFRFPLAMVSGLRDFNFNEQYYGINSPKATDKNLIALHWEGKHEWPDSIIIKEATSFVLYKSGLLNEEDIDREEQMKKAELAQKSNNLFLYFKQLELISKTASSKLQQKALTSIASMQQSAKAQLYFSEINTIFKEEQVRNQMYYTDLDEKDLDWWKSKIDKINELTDGQKSLQADSYARTKAYLGILLFSKTRSALNGQANAKLVPKYLSIYEILEPENADIHYFKALYAYRLENNEDAIKNLKIAFELGFNDDSRLKIDFPPMIISAAQKS